MVNFVNAISRVTMSPGSLMKNNDITNSIVRLVKCASDNGASVQVKTPNLKNVFLFGKHGSGKNNVAKDFLGENSKIVTFDGVKPLSRNTDPAKDRARVLELLNKMGDIGAQNRHSLFDSKTQRLMDALDAPILNRFSILNKK